MEKYKYLIIGGGMTADAAAKGIREIDSQGSIGMVSIEKDPPYNRPPLTKGLWKGKPLDSIWRKTEDKHVSLYLGRTIVSLDLDDDKMVAHDNQGQEYQGEKLLLATGGKPRRLPFGGDDILYYRTVESYRILEKMSRERQDFAVIGGGFIGAEIAAALAMNGKKVTMVFPEEGIGALVYPHDVSQFLNDYYRKKGVEVLNGENVTGVSAQGKRQILQTQSGREVSAEGVVAGIGIQPNVSLAKEAGLQVEKGIIVNEALVTSHPNVYAAGDVAEFFNPALDKRLRIEHEDNANSMGKQAGRNMAGAAESFTYLPYFYSDLFELGYEAIGELDSRLTTAADWAEPFQKGVIYYFKDDRVRGVLLWNVWDRVPAARQLIAAPGPFKPEDLRENAPHLEDCVLAHMSAQNLSDLTVTQVLPEQREATLKGLFLDQKLVELCASLGRPLVLTSFLTDGQGIIAMADEHRHFAIPEEFKNDSDWRLFQELMAKSDAVIGGGSYLRRYATLKSHVQDIMFQFEPGGRFEDLGVWRRKVGFARRSPDMVFVTRQLDFDIPEKLLQSGRKIVVFTTGAEDDTLKAQELAGAGVTVIGSGQTGVDGIQLVDYLARELGHRVITSAAGPGVLQLLLDANRLDLLYVTEAQLEIQYTDPTRVITMLAHGRKAGELPEFRVTHEYRQDRVFADDGTLLSQIFRRYDHIEVPGIISRVTDNYGMK